MPHGGFPEHEYNTLKKAFHRRVSDEFRYKEFAKLRDQFRRDGKGQKSWMWAAWYFPPLDGSEHEIFFGPEFDAMPGKPPEPPPPPMLAEKGAGKNLIKYGKTDEDAVATKAEQKTTPEWEAFTEAVSDSPKIAETQWSKLMKAIPSDRKSPFVQSLQWCFDKCGTPLSELKPDEIPSRGTLFLLKHMSSGGASYAEVLRTMMTKLIPTGKDQDAAARFEDDGREIVSALDAFDAEFAGEEVEDAA